MLHSFSLMGVEKSANHYFTLTDAEISKKLVKVDNYGGGVCLPAQPHEMSLVILIIQTAANFYSPTVSR